MFRGAEVLLRPRLSVRLSCGTDRGIVPNRTEKPDLPQQVVKTPKMLSLLVEAWFFLMMVVVSRHTTPNAAK